MSGAIESSPPRTQRLAGKTKGSVIPKQTLPVVCALCVLCGSLSASPREARGSQPPAPSPWIEADGTTPLHPAVRRNDTARVEVLLGAGADARATTRYGVTPLYLACVNGNAAVIEKLLAAGADANTALPEGETALMTAARTGSVPAIKALLAHGATVNAKEGWKGQTALMWAAAENNAEAARTLIDAGADIKARSKSGAFSAYCSRPARVTSPRRAPRRGRGYQREAARRHGARSC